VDLVSSPERRFIELKIKGRIAEMMAIFDRFIVLTVLGKIRIYVGVFDEHKITKCDASIDLGLDQYEKVTAACISRDSNYMAVATQKHNNSNLFYPRVRLYEIVTAKKLKFLTYFEDTETRDPNTYIMHIQINHTINSYPLITCMIHSHPHEFTSFIFYQHKIRRYTYPYPIAKGNISCVRATRDGYWMSSVDGTVSKLETHLS
jgi:hypothetical protein